MSDWPQTADVVVIGGGVAGLSTAMQLATRGWRVVVLERQQLGNGSTGRAAGLLGQLRGTAESTRMLMDGVEIVRELEQRANVEIFVQTGSLRVAQTPDRVQEVKSLVAMGKSIGFDIDHMPIEEVADVLPYMETDGLLDACYCPTDGHLQPAELVAAYLHVGREQGVLCESQCPVEEILIEKNRVVGVKTPRGSIAAPTVINAGGPWSYLVANLVETPLQTTAMGHVYLTTRPDPTRPIDLYSPAIRDRHLRIYARPESGGLIVGMYGEETTHFDMQALPTDFDMSAMKARRDDLQVARLIDAAHQRYPWIDERTPMTMTTGIMTFTPDGKPLCGKLPNVDGLFYCSGFCGHGIVQSPTIGVIMADLMIDGQTDYDIAAIEADRFWEIPGFQERDQIAEHCDRMHASYYGKVEGQEKPPTG